MCHAIIRIKYRVKETASVEAETSEALAERVATLEANDEVVEYRVFISQGKKVRVSGWEDRP